MLKIPRSYNTRQTNRLMLDYMQKGKPDEIQDTTEEDKVGYCGFYIYARVR